MQMGFYDNDNLFKLEINKFCLKKLINDQFLIETNFKLYFLIN